MLSRLSLSQGRYCGPRGPRAQPRVRARENPKRQMVRSGGVCCLLCVFCVGLRRYAVGRRGVPHHGNTPSPNQAPPPGSKINLEFPCNLPRKLIIGCNQYPFSYISEKNRGGGVTREWEGIETRFIRYIENTILRYIYIYIYIYLENTIFRYMYIYIYLENFRYDIQHQKHPGTAETNCCMLNVWYYFLRMKNRAKKLPALGDRRSSNIIVALCLID